MIEHSFLVYVAIISILIGLLLFLIAIWLIIRIKRLKKKEARLIINQNIFFANLPQPYIKLNLQINNKEEFEDFTVIDLNSEFEKEFELNKKSIIGKTAKELGFLKSPEDRLKYQCISENRKVYTVEYYHKQTKKHYTAIYYCSKKQQDVYVFLVDKTDEHTATKNNENLKSLLNSILDNIPIPLYVKEIGDDIRYTLWNKKAEEFFGIKSEDIIGKTDLEAFGERYGTIILENEDSIVKNGGILSYEEKIPVNNDIRTTSVLKTHSKTKDRSSYLIATRWDITELKRIQNLLKLENHKLALALNAGNIVPLTCQAYDPLHQE